MSLNPQFSADLVLFTEEIFNGKLHFLCSDLNVEMLAEMLKLKIEFQFQHFRFAKHKV